jgi:hypothetical protein
MIKQGDHIKCYQCNNTVYIAAQDIENRSQMKSDYFLQPDSTGVPCRAKCICPECGAMFRTIDSESKLTVQWGNDEKCKYI